MTAMEAQTIAGCVAEKQGAFRVYDTIEDAAASSDDLARLPFICAFATRGKERGPRSHG